MATTTLRGNLVSDPKFFEGKNPESDRVNFTIAENRRDSDGEALDPFYHDVVAWGQNARNIADSADVFKKGEYVICEAQIVQRKREVLDVETKQPFNITVTSYRTNELLKGTRFATIDQVTANEKSGGSRGKASRSRDEDEAPRGRSRSRAAEPAEDVNDEAAAPAEDAELVGAGAARGAARGSGRGAGRAAGRGRAARGSESRDW